MTRKEELAALAAKFAAFPKGARVVFHEDADRYPHCVVPKGTTGTVSDSCPDGVLVKVDGDVPGLTDSAEWEGEFQWFVVHVEDIDEPEAPFTRFCEHAGCAATCSLGCTWTDDDPTCSRCKCTRPEDA
jgi:hypothetical protein